MRLNSLAFRLFATAAVWVLVAIPAAAVLIVSIYRSDVERNFDAGLGIYLTNLVADSTRTGATAPVAPSHIGEPLFELPFSGWYWQIGPITPNAEVAPLFVSESLLDERLVLPKEMQRDENSYRRGYVKGPNDQLLRVLEREITFEESKQKFTYVVAGDVAEMADDVSDFTTLVISALAVLGLGLVVASGLQVRFGLRPLRAIERRLGAIRSGASEQLEGRLPDEIVPLQRELNALLMANRDIVERARTHVGNLAHALKTPLSVITNEARASDAALARKVVEQAAIMNGQITHHLDRARVAARLGAIGSVTEVAPAIDGLQRALERIHEARALHVESVCAPGLKFQGEKQDFEEMVGNLLDNACKWARSRVMLTASAGNGAPPALLSVIVDDDGPGLTAGERSTVIKRGQKLDEAVPGSGLGLSIVAELAHLYRGRFSLAPSPEGGLRALLELPRA